MDRSRYIDVEMYCKNCNCVGLEKGCEKEKCPIWNAPTADVAPIRHGRWIWHESQNEYECSFCHDKFDYAHTWDLFDHGFQQASYCPNCGAKMDLEYFYSLGEDKE